MTRYTRSAFSFIAGVALLSCANIAGAEADETFRVDSGGVRYGRDA